MHTASLTIKRVGEYPHLLQKDEKMTAYDNPLAEALASLDGCTITVEKKAADPGVSKVAQPI